MLWCAFAAVRHADGLAEILGEPYGTLILTISVIAIEVSVISAVMLNGDANPTLARDTMLAVVIIVMNGMVGLTLLIGGLRHVEQEFNLQGARAFLGVLMTLATLSLILPAFTLSTPDGSLDPVQAVLFSVVTVALYATFLAIQTTRHRAYFIQPEAGDGGARIEEAREHQGEHGSLSTHAVMLILSLVPIVLLSKKLAVLIDHGTEAIGLPEALGGVVVALLVLAPEGLAAVEAAMGNRLQRSVNICLGSALATISLTVPAVIVVGLLTGTQVVLGLDGTEMVLLVLTLVLSLVTFGGLRTNVLQGAVHLVVFFVYLVLIFDP